MFELYGIGKGPQIAEGDYTNYTEDDIKAATRVLTGWELDDTFAYLDPDTSLPAGKMRSHLAGNGITELATEHDAGQKVFSPNSVGPSLSRPNWWKDLRPQKLPMANWMP